MIMFYSFANIHCLDESDVESSGAMSTDEEGEWQDHHKSHDAGRQLSSLLFGFVFFAVPLQQQCAEDHDTTGKFAQSRKAHYNMAEALRRAKELLSKEGEDEEE